MSGKSLEALELEQEESIRFQNCSLFPSLSWKCKSNIGIDNLIEVITNKFYSSTHRGPSELCGNVFKIEYTKRQRLAYIRLYSGVLHLRDSVRVSEKEKIKVTEMYTSINGELCKIDRAYSGEIVILQNEFLKLNSVLGDTKLLPQRKRLKIRTLYYKQLLNRVNLNREKCCLMPFWKSQIVIRFYDITWILRHMKLYFLS